MTNPKADADITSQSTGSPTIDVVDRHITEWLKLQSSLREDNRFFPPSSEWAEKMISASVSRRSGLEVGTPVFRARINGGDRMRMPLQRHEMGANPMAPPGRLNPEGIPCLYLSFDSPTALAEMRPWPGARVSVAEGTTTKPLSIADLSGQVSKALDSDGIMALLLAELVGRPVHQEDPLEYLTTQYLAQGLKRGRLDGVKFRSAVTPEGINLALFDTTAVGFKDVSL